MKKKTLSVLPHKEKKIKYIRKNEDIFCGMEIIPEKNVLLDYLTAFYPNFSTTGRVYDNVKRITVESIVDNGYFDGEYYWDETDIYHLKKYNMPIDPEFIEYVLTKLGNDK